jgi:hypothetical protein
MWKFSAQLSAKQILLWKTCYNDEGLISWYEVEKGRGQSPDSKEVEKGRGQSPDSII